MSRSRGAGPASTAVVLPPTAQQGGGGGVSTAAAGAALGGGGGGGLALPDQEFVSFVERSLRRNDHELSALQEIHGRLRILREELERQDPLLLLELGRGKIRLTTATASPAEDEEQQAAPPAPKAVGGGVATTTISSTAAAEESVIVVDRLIGTSEASIRRVEALQQAQQAQDEESEGVDNDGTGIPSLYDLSVGFLLHFKLRRRLLNRLARRLLRVAHAMDNLKIVPETPALPSYGDLSLHVDPQAVQALEQVRHEQERILKQNLKDMLPLSSSCSPSSDLPAHPVPEQEPSASVIMPPPAATSSQQQQQQQQQQAVTPAAPIRAQQNVSVTAENVPSAETTATAKPDSSTSETKDDGLVEDKTTEGITHVQRHRILNSCLPRFEYQAFLEYKDAYEKRIPLPNIQQKNTKKNESNNTIRENNNKPQYTMTNNEPGREPVKEDYERFPPGTMGIGALPQSRLIQTASERQAEFHRWKTSLLGKIPNQPPLFAQPHVFHYQQRRKATKQALKQAQAQAAALEKNTKKEESEAVQSAPPSKVPPPISSLKGGFGKTLRRPTEAEQQKQTTKQEDHDSQPEKDPMEEQGMEKEEESGEEHEIMDVGQMDSEEAEKEGSGEEQDENDSTNNSMSGKEGGEENSVSDADVDSTTMEEKKGGKDVAPKESSDVENGASKDDDDDGSDESDPKDGQEVAETGGPEAMEEDGGTDEDMRKEEEGGTTESDPDDEEESDGEKEESASVTNEGEEKESEMEKTGASDSENGENIHAGDEAKEEQSAMSEDEDAANKNVAEKLNKEAKVTNAEEKEDRATTAEDSKKEEKKETNSDEDEEDVEDCEDPIKNLKRPISLIPTPSFYDQDMKRIRLIHCELMNTSMRNHAHMRMEEVTRDYNAAFKTSNALFERRQAMQAQLQEMVQENRTYIDQMNSDYEAKLAMATSGYLMRRRHADNLKLDHLMPNRHNTQHFPEGTPMTHLYMRQPDITRQIVAQYVGGIVDAVAQVNQGIKRNDIFREEFRPPPKPDAGLSHKQRMEEQIKQEINSLTVRLRASEEERNRTWKRMMKTKAEFDLPHHHMRAKVDLNMSNYQNMPAPPLRQSSTQNIPQEVLRPVPSATSAYVPQARRSVTQQAPAASNHESIYSKYSANRVRARIASDGTVAPVTAPKRNKDGLFARPAGRQRRGMDWDAVRGVWVPSDNVQQE